MATDTTTEPAGTSGLNAEEAPLPVEAAGPAIRISDMGGALTACEVSQPEGWSACITRELEARDYRVEVEAGEAGVTAAPAASEAGTVAGAGEPAPAS